MVGTQHISCNPDKPFRYQGRKSGSPAGPPPQLLRSTDGILNTQGMAGRSRWQQYSASSANYTCTTIIGSRVGKDALNLDFTSELTNVRNIELNFREAERNKTMVDEYAWLVG